MAEERAEEPERPGPRHEKLMRRAGSYRHLTTIQVRPEDEPEVFEGDATFTPALGGRFLLEERNMRMAGDRVEYLKFHGYNAATEQYESLWTFNFKTSMLFLAGVEEDGGQTVRWSGSYTDLDEGEVAIEAATHEVDDDHFVLEVYGKGPNGERFTVQETSYTRTS